jgi:hypothetical protein
MNPAKHYDVHGQPRQRPLNANGAYLGSKTVLRRGRSACLSSGNTEPNFMGITTNGGDTVHPEVERL